MRNFVKFHPTTENSEISFKKDFFCPKYIKFEQRKYRGVIFHDTEQ